MTSYRQMLLDLFIIITQSMIIYKLLYKLPFFPYWLLMQAAVLHDTVEDTDTSFEELERVFGSEVKGLVAEVSDDKSLPKLERKRLQVSYHKVGVCIWDRVLS